VVLICLRITLTSLSGMEGERLDSSLDLSHLTEDEQSSILEVLQRDSELRNRDEGRVRSVCGDYNNHFCSFGNVYIQ